MCRILKVSRAGYYAWKRRTVSHHYLIDRILEYRIKQIFDRSRETYGSPRVHAALKREGVQVSRKRVARLMKENGLKARCVRVYRKMAKLHRFYQRILNIRKDLPKPTAVNQHWAADLTYIRQGNRWLYLGKRKSVTLTMSSLRMAIRNRHPNKGLIFHTDRGVEYRSHDVQKRLKQHGIKPSMNRPGCCTDNAEMESFFHSLKAELIKERKFYSEWHLRDKLAGYIQHFYNKIRLHSSLKYQSPVEYEAKTR